MRLIFLLGILPLASVLSQGQQATAVASLAQAPQDWYRGSGSSCLDSQLQYETGAFPLHVDTGDIDGDGFQDAVVANHFGNSITILYGTGNGLFFRSDEIDVGANPVHISTGDINNDTFDDIVVSCRDSDEFFVFVSGTDGHSFSPLVQTMMGKAYAAIITQMVPGGFSELVFFSNECSTKVFGINENSELYETAEYSGPCLASDALVGDFNNDSTPDVAYLDRAGSSSTIGVMLVNSQGGLLSHRTYPFAHEPQDFDTGDFNDDGFLDIAVANWGGGNGLVLINDRTGGYELPLTIPAPMPHDVAVGDINRDGHDDIVFSQLLTDTIEVHLGDGSGQFTLGETQGGAINDPRGLITLDINSDGSDDIMQVVGGNRLVTYLNSCERILTGCDVDLDGNGELNFFDVSAFIVFHSLGSDEADINGDGLLNFFDVSLFLQLLQMGCP
mgnify:CR=1 FL=1|tara:strand:- start:2165 stop:3499 length:1335 start_codon:yes stop_codon:yes gene_type:complete